MPRNFCSTISYCEKKIMFVVKLLEEMLCIYCTVKIICSQILNTVYSSHAYFSLLSITMITVLYSWKALNLRMSSSAIQEIKYVERTSTEQWWYLRYYWVFFDDTIQYMYIHVLKQFLHLWLRTVVASLWLILHFLYAMNDLPIVQNGWKNLPFYRSDQWASGRPWSNDWKCHWLGYLMTKDACREKYSHFSLQLL